MCNFSAVLSSVILLVVVVVLWYLWCSGIFCCCYYCLALPCLPALSWLVFLLSYPTAFFIHKFCSLYASFIHYIVSHIELLMTQEASQSSLGQGFCMLLMSGSLHLNCMFNSLYINIQTPCKETFYLFILSSIRMTSWSDLYPQISQLVDSFWQYMWFTTQEQRKSREWRQ